MATLGDWWQAARPRTLPAAIAPVLVGTGAAESLGRLDVPVAVLCLLISLSLQVGVNFANDYSDGIRGTDVVRVGPARLTASGGATPATVRAVAFAFFGLTAVLGSVVTIVTGLWWLPAVGVACILAAWFYTGGSRPYGYAGFGEVFVFVFFGLVAVLGTCYVQARALSLTALAAAIGIGLLACALLVANNLRDIRTDAAVGKRTLAVMIGEPMTRVLFVVLMTIAFVAVGVVGIGHPWCLLALGAAPLAVAPALRVRRGAQGRELIEVLGATARVELAYAALLTVGLVLD